MVLADIAHADDAETHFVHSLSLRNVAKLPMAILHVGK